MATVESWLTRREVRGAVPAVAYACRWLVALIAVLGGPFSPSAAAGAPPAFAKRYVREATLPLPVIDSFPACRPGAGRLRVEAGPAGTAAPTLAVVVMNQRSSIVVGESRPLPRTLERAVTLEASNTLLVWLIGAPGATLAVTVTPDVACLEVAVASPSAGEAVAAGPLVVRGTVEGPPDVGVTVNGLPAAVVAGAFAAVIPVEPDDTEVVARATSASGAVAEAHRPIVVVPAVAEPVFTLVAHPRGGAAPLTVRFTVAGDEAIDEIAIDLTGDGAVDFAGPSLDGVAFKYDSPGLYEPTVTVTDASGASHTASTLLQVSDRAVVEAAVQARWQGLKDALRRGDLAGALSGIATRARDSYGQLLGALTVPLGQIDQVLTDISLVDLDEDQATCEMLRLDDGVAISHFVLFVRDADGIWRVKFF
jgi:hypothetical protein